MNTVFIVTRWNETESNVFVAACETAEAAQIMVRAAKKALEYRASENFNFNITVHYVMTEPEAQEAENYFTKKASEVC